MSPAPLPPAAPLPEPLVDSPVGRVFFSTPAAARHFLEFFAARVRNVNTRRAYLRAAARFAAWCERAGLGLAALQPLHVAAYLEQLSRERSRPTVKQHLAALRMLFDWLVVTRVLDANPAAAVRGPKHQVRRGKTPVLTADEMRLLLESIDAASLSGLRDRALIGLMAFSFARIGAALAMRVEDYYIQGRRGWIRLQEKGGKVNEMPCHHRLEQFLEEYLRASGLDREPAAPLFPSFRLGRLTRNPLVQANALAMVRRRAAAAGIRTRITNHTFRATGITTYLQNGGRLEIAQQMAGHESPRTTSLYDRRHDTLALDEIERIAY